MYILVTRLPGTCAVIFLVDIFQAKALALIRGKQSKCRAQLQIFVRISDSAFEAQTELSTCIAVDLVADLIIYTINSGVLFGISVRTVSHLHLRTQVLSGSLLKLITIARLIHDLRSVINFLSSFTTGIILGLVNRILEGT